MNNPLLDTSSLPRFRDISPDDTVPALNQLISEHRRKLDELLDALVDGTESLDFQSLVTPLEEMNHELGRVWSPVGHLQSVLDHAGWRDAYKASLPILTKHGTELSQNSRLQQAFQKVADTMSADTPESMRSLVDQALRDFRLAGVSLPEAQKDQFKAIMQELADVQASFDHNVQDAQNHWSWQTQDKNDLTGIPDTIIVRAEQEAIDKKLTGWLFKLDFPTYHAVITHADNRDLRMRYYKAWSTRGSDQGDARFDNTDNIHKILSLRHQLAQLVQFDNYAQYSLATKMAAESSEVLEFLSELAAQTRPTAEKEFAAVSAIADEPLQAWDLPYYLEKLKQQRYSVSDDELRQYFPAQKVLDGMFELAEKLYGVTLKRNDDVQTWHDTVMFFDVQDENGNEIGSFYTDLYARNGKRNGAWIDECITRKKLNGSTVLPVGYLVCNFSPPDSSGISLLTHNEVLTTFHEFGHMLHHLLTRVDYPSIAGINGVPWDAVELPSQFMENFAWCYDVLERTSGHHKTGEPLPRDLFDKLNNSRHFGAGLAMLRQIEFALFDFRLHAEFDPDQDNDPLALLKEVRNEVALIHHPDYNRLPHAFTHIFAGGYAAGYYSYKWAEVLAADAFSAFEEAGIFDRETAGRFRSEILEVGGSRDIMDAFVAFRGRKPTLDALLRYSGIDKAA
jgi:oligopeptidase A